MIRRFLWKILGLKNVTNIVSVGAGDLLIITVDSRTIPQEVDALRKTLDGVMPEGVKVLVWRDSLNGIFAIKKESLK